MIAEGGHSPSDMGPTATLPETLAAWRLERSSTLANRVDEVAARTVAPQVPPRKLQRWWTDQAAAYDPVTATALLASLEVDAQSANVSWRIILMRDTPISRVLRATGFEGEPQKSEWMNLLDRIGLMLTWPDDPRVAMALAGWLWRLPFLDRRFRHARRDPFFDPIVDVIARRIIEIGDVRALTRIVGVCKFVGEATRAALDDALANVPSPRTVDATLAEAWRAVVDDPHNLSNRLVLADAYSDCGDPRGELIALQCAPLIAIAKAQAECRMIDRGGVFGVGSQRIQAILEAHWHRWFGELSLIFSSSTLHGGLLHMISVGHDRAPAWAWPHAAQHRELCAVERIAPAPRLVEKEPDTYAGFLCTLRRQPRWVGLEERTLAVLRGEQIPFTGVRLAVGSGGALATTRDLVAIAPKLERLELSFGHAQHMDAIHEVVAQFPYIKIEMVKDGW
jgi:uncharacterized protein (TIGR02996 family)